MRLLAGVLAAQPFNSQLIGDESLSRRPMDRIVNPLQKMGAQITEGPPLSIQPLRTPLNGIEYTLPVASAQVKSCLLLAGLYATSPTVLVENVLTRDHTERMLTAFGAKLTMSHHRISLAPGGVLHGQAITIPGDISSAAFFIAGASFTPDSHIILRQVGVNPRRMGMIRILEQMGANIQIHSLPPQSGEPMADIEVKGPTAGMRLQGIYIQQEWVASAIDEFPMIFVVAAMAKGETIIRGIQELRFKETDRIAVMARGLKTLGVPLAILPDGIIIRGSPQLEGGKIDCEGDHRVAMAFAMAGLKAKSPIILSDAENIVTSFPQFALLANKLGLTIQPYTSE